jgi:hypothetical protein
MKHFFKYEYGYINIDHENLFMTNSGNWSETKDLKEKSHQSNSENIFRKSKVFGYYLFLGLIILFFVYMFSFVNITYGFIIGIAILFYAGYNFMKSEQGNRYKIPLNKICKMEYSHKSLKIYFKNLENKEDFERIENLESKGIKVLNDLGLIKE